MLVILMTLALWNEPIYATPGTAVLDIPAPTSLSYDAVGDDQRRRKQPGVDRRSEDRILDSGRRERATANSRDLYRNYSLIQWAVRRHLDYVTTFTFHARNEDEGLNTEIEAMMADRAAAANCDTSRRHTLPRMFRMLEARATVDNDCALAYMDDGRIQGIEGDRIRQPFGFGLDTNIDSEWVQGVHVNAQNEALEYSVHRRTVGGGFEFERLVPADNFWLHGTFERFDQVRGISPIISALNSFRDLYEATEFALAKAKIMQIFGLVFYEDQEEAAGDVTTDAATGKPRVNYGRGPFNLNQQREDRVEAIQDEHPSSQFQDFTRLVVMVALKALDIPYSFFDEAHTNFFGSRGSWMHYERSSQHKREVQLELRNDYTLWQYRTWIRDRQLKLPRRVKVTDLRHEWVPMGMPWWDPSKEINGAIQECAAGFNNPFRVTKESGNGDFEDNLKQLQKAQKLAIKYGVVLNFTPLANPINVVAADDVVNQKPKP